MYPFIRIFGIGIPMYTVMFILAILAAWLLLRFLSKKSTVPPIDVNLTFLMGASGGLIGAVSLRPIMHTVRIALSWTDYRDHTFVELVNIATGEIVFYGGLLGGLTAILLFCLKFKIDLVQIFDICAPALALAHAIGRAGCFFAGCCFGMRVDEYHPLYALAVVFPEDSLGAPSGIPILPTQLMETVFLLVLSAVTVTLFLTLKKHGMSSATYLFAYPVWRFFLEYFRADFVRGTYGPFTTSQYISLGLLVFAVCYVIFLVRKKKEPVESASGDKVK